MCRSEPQIAVDVTRRITSSGFWIVGSGTVSTETLPGAWKTSAFIAMELSNLRLSFGGGARLRLLSERRFQIGGQEFLRFLGFVFVLFLVRCGGIGVHCRFGEFGQLRVGFLFLIERFLEEFGEIVVAEASREGAGGAVARDFVMLDALRRADEAGIANALFRIFIDQLRALFDQAFHGFACVPGELFAKLLADLREPLDVPFGLLEVFFEAGFELWICRGLRHLRERFDELVFSAVEVFEFVKEEIF